MLFLDFDGVIIDSIEECYMVSRETYYGYSKFNFDESSYKDLFYKYRGLVKPASEYYCLHKAIEENNSNNYTDTIEILFNKNVCDISVEQATIFESKFFYTRLLHQENHYSDWIKMNPLTEFGKLLVGRNNDDVYIVTTKNKHATESILKNYNISVKSIYTNDDIKSAGSKGNLISEIIDKKKIKNSIFVDDAVEHLDTNSDARVKCFFADWGYGENTDYQIFHKEIWVDYL